MTELRDLYNEYSVKTNLTYHKGDSIPDGYYPMVVMVAIQNSDGEFLMQKRTPNKGGSWGVTGGHPKSGETPRQGIVTEVKEELGLDFYNESFEEFASGCDGNDCYIMYYLKKDIDLSDIIIQEDELTEVRWFTMEQLEEMVNNNELDQNQFDFFIKCSDYISKERTLKRN